MALFLQATILLNCDEETGLHIANELKSLSIHLELNSWEDFDIFENASSSATMHKLHEPTKDTNNPSWQKGLIEILEKTSVPEAGRIMIYDNLAGLYDHHLHMYMLNKKQEPEWDIVQATSFKEAGFPLSPLKIFTDLSLAAKAGQALRLGSEKK